MPRGKDAPTITGGQIDPYVASSIQQGKQQSQNRLLTAMKEAGAGSRTATQERGASERAAMGNQAQLRAQAAQAESDDKRAAEAERGRREDREFAKVEAQVSRDFEVKQEESRRLFEKSLIEENRKETRESRQMMLDVQGQQLQDILESEERSTNAITSTLKGMSQQELAKEKMETLSAEATDEADQIEDVHTSLIEGSTRKFSERDKSYFLGGFDNFSSDSAKSVGSGMVMEALNDLDKNFQYEDLFSRNIQDVSDKIKEGKLVPEDLRTALGVLDGVTANVEQRLKEATDPDEIKFWDHQNNMLFGMRDGLLGLLQNKDPIPGSPGQTVGSKMRDAFGPVLGFSQGQRIKQRKAFRVEAGVSAPFSLLEDYTKSIDPYKPREYPANASAFTKELIDRRNATYDAAGRNVNIDIEPEEQPSIWGAN